MKNKIDINPDILTWAVKRAGYNVDDFIPVFPEFKDWLDKNKKPTLRQLQNFARKVHVPFGYLFLQQPPKEELPIPFYRTTKNNFDNVSVNLYDTVLRVKQRQEWLTEYLKDNEFEPLFFVGKYNIHGDYQVIASDIRNTLGLDEQWAGYFPNWEEALDYLTQKIEDIGIIVIFNSVVGNNTHRPIDVEECRGFVLVDNYAPFMFINAADSKAAQMFTILHELAHIWTGESAGFDFRQLQPADDPIEKLCDKTAAEFLVPYTSFEEHWTGKKEYKYLSKYFKVSPIVVARRALDLGKITREEFFSFYNEYMASIKNKKQNQPGGGDFYRTARKRISPTFAAHVDHAVKSGQLLYRNAYKLTDLKGDTFHKFFKDYMYS
jgi:Zn-dependent peptidase ImmA (M78 family)